MVASIGLALTVGVLVDALVVRMVLVPATLQLLGEASWWLPRGLDRVLPRIDTEGAALEQDEVDQVLVQTVPFRVKTAGSTLGPE